LAAQLADARRDVDTQVGKVLQIFRNVPEVLGKVADMQPNEVRFGMTREDLFLASINSAFEENRGRETTNRDDC